MTRDTVQEARPSLVGILDPRAHQAALDEVLFGIEEEGISWVIRQESCEDVRATAYVAAQESRLAVGFAADARLLVLHQRNLPPHKPFLTLENYATYAAEQLKDFGCNAARLFKGQPLKECGNE